MHPSRLLMMAVLTTTLSAGEPLPPTVAPGASLEVVHAATGTFFEGPAWHQPSNTLFVSALSANQILRLPGGASPAVWLAASQGANGTWSSTLSGKLLIAQGTAKRVIACTVGPTGPTATEVLAEGGEFNQPNDLVETAKGLIYVTDPRVGVFVIPPGGPARKLIASKDLTDPTREVVRPNGIIASADGRTVIIADSAQKKWRRYAANATTGDLALPGTDFFAPDVADQRDPDGMDVDEHGNFYLTGRGGVWVVGPGGGDAKGLIPLAKNASNVAFGGADGRTLFITGQDEVLRIRMRVRGAQFPKPAPTVAAELAGDLVLSKASGSLFSAANSSGATQMAFGPDGGLYLASTKGIHRFQYNQATGQLSDQTLIASGQAFGIAFHGNDLYCTRKYTLNLDTGITAQPKVGKAFGRIERIGLGDGNGDGRFETLSPAVEIVGGIPVGEHPIAQLQIAGDTLYVGIGSRTFDGVALFRGDRIDGVAVDIGEAAYTAAIGIIRDLRQVGTAANAAGFFPSVLTTHAQYVDIAKNGDAPLTFTGAGRDGKLLVFANGLRNPYGVALDGDGEVWTTNNHSRDDAIDDDGDGIADRVVFHENDRPGPDFRDDVHDQLFRVRERSDAGYRNANWRGNAKARAAGWFAAGNRIASATFDGLRPKDHPAFPQRPLHDPEQPIGLGPHSCATGLAFYAGNAFPARLHRRAYIARWNDQVEEEADPARPDDPDEFLVFSDVVAADHATGATARIASGFHNPIAVLNTPEGALLIADHSEAIYRLAARAPAAGTHDLAWASDQSGAWSQAARWSPAIVPDQWGSARYAVRIARGGQPAVTVDQDALIESLRLEERLVLPGPHVLRTTAGLVMAGADAALTIVVPTPAAPPALVVGGSATLAGALTLDLGFTPADGQVIRPIAWNSASGAFASVTVRAPAGFRAEAVAEATGLRVTLRANAAPTLVVSAATVQVAEGGSAGFQVSLSSAPTANVVVSVGALAGGDGDLTVDPTSLTFTPANFATAQTVTVAAREDADAANGSATIRCSASGLASRDVTAREVDNDVLAILTSAAAVNVAEGGSAAFTVRLSAAPTANLTVSVARQGGGDGDLSVSPASLTFTPANFATAQTVTVAAGEDADAVNGTASIRCSASGLADRDVTATEVDNDTLAIITSVAALSVLEGADASFTVRLSAAPTANLTVSITRQPGGDSDLSAVTTTLTFTPGNFATAQSVTIRAAQDADAANGSAAFRCAASGVATRDVTVSEADDDTLGLVVSTTAVAVPEGSSATFTVRLSAAPTANVEVGIARQPGGDGDLEVGPATLSFTPGDFATPKTVTVTARSDADLAHGRASIRCSASGLADVVVTAREIDTTVLRIDFQPVQAPPVPGHRLDTGLPFGERGDGLRYGWSTDVTATARDRNAIGDQARDTLIHMQKGAGSDWRIELPNGDYDLTLACGDPAFFNSVYRVAAEGVVVVDGTPSSGTRHFTSTRRVGLADGSLDLTSAEGAENNKVQFLTITPVAPLAANN